MRRLQFSTRLILLATAMLAVLMAWGRISYLEQLRRKAEEKANPPRSIVIPD